MRDLMLKAAFQMEKETSLQVEMLMTENAFSDEYPKFYYYRENYDVIVKYLKHVY